MGYIILEWLNIVADIHPTGVRMYIKRVSELQGSTCGEEIAMKVAAAVLFAVVVVFAIPSCCEGYVFLQMDDAFYSPLIYIGGHFGWGKSSFQFLKESGQDRMNVVEKLSLYYDSLWFEGLFGPTRISWRVQLHARDRTDKAFKENKVQLNTKRWPSSLTNSLTDTCFPFPSCCEGSEQDRENAAKGLSPYGDSSQQQLLRKKSLVVIVASRKWFEGVISEPCHAQSHVYDRIKKAFEERNYVRLRARRWLGPLTSCRSDVEVSAFKISLVC